MAGVENEDPINYAIDVLDRVYDGTAAMTVNTQKIIDFDVKKKIYYSYRKKSTLESVAEREVTNYRAYATEDGDWREDYEPGDTGDVQLF